MSRALERRTVIETVSTPWQGVVLPLYQHRSELFFYLEAHSVALYMGNIDSLLPV